MFRSVPLSSAFATILAGAALTAGVASANFADAPSRLATVHPTKVLTIVEENHSYAQMKSGMPYLWSLAQKYGYATKWMAITHPSLPNYLAIGGGSTFEVIDDGPPSKNPVSALSVFDQTISAGKTAKVYAESMPSNCTLTGGSPYAVRHNPWTYFAKPTSRSNCQKYDVPAGSATSGAFVSDVAGNTLPNIGMLIPNTCNDAHDCSLTVADGWLKARLPKLLSSADFTSGRLAVVITADEGDHSAGTTAPSTVLTVVLHTSLSGKVVTTALTHYSLSKLYSQTGGTAPLLKAASAPDMRTAFGL